MGEMFGDGVQNTETLSRKHLKLLTNLTFIHLQQ